MITYHKMLYRRLSTTKVNIRVSCDQCDQIGQLFKACGNNYFAQIAHIFKNFCKDDKVFHVSSGIILGQLF